MILLSSRFGRKKTVAIPLFIGSILCIGAAFMPSKATASVSKRKIANILYSLRQTEHICRKFDVAISTLHFDGIHRMLYCPSRLIYVKQSEVVS